MYDNIEFHFAKSHLYLLPISWSWGVRKANEKKKKKRNEPNNSVMEHGGGGGGGTKKTRNQFQIVIHFKKQCPDGPSTKAEVPFYAYS